MGKGHQDGRAILAMTQTYELGLAVSIHSKVYICPAFNPVLGSHPTVKGFIALWDTGSTMTCISQRVVDECSLHPTGAPTFYHEVDTFERKQADTYPINLLLPGKIGVSNLKACKRISSSGDVIIGMDVINRGDFAISNFNGKTMMSFRVPSLGHIDFCDQAEAPVR